MMKKLLSCLLPFLFLAGAFAQQRIEFTVKDVHDTSAILAYYYGAKKYIYDTLAVGPTGKAIIRPKAGDLVIPGGIYLFVFPDNSYLEFIISEPRFSLTTSMSKPLEDLKAEGSRENEAFFTDLRIVTRYSKQLQELNQQLKEAKDPNKQIQLQVKIRALQKTLERKRDSLAHTYRGTLYAKLIRAMKTPQLPEPLKRPDGTVDSLYPYRYYREHYWDSVDLSDDRLIRTPVLEYKLKEFLDRAVAPHPDSIIQAVDQLLYRVWVEGSEEMRKFFLTQIVNRYAKEAEKYMGMDEVYVHLVLKYVTSPSVTWVDSAKRVRMVSRAMQMEPLLIGKTGPNITVQDANGKKHALYDVDADYTILLYWTPDCGHCRKYVPKTAAVIDSMIQEDHIDVKVFSVYTKHDKQQWLDFIKNHKLMQKPWWIHVYEPDEKNYDYKLAYDAFATPTIYILDRAHTIIAKKLGPSQIRDFLNRHRRTHAQGKKGGE